MSTYGKQAEMLQRLSNGRVRSDDTGTGMAHARAIKRVVISQLFGGLNYDLDLPQDELDDGVSLAILYGENGSGKTTILRLIYALLSDQCGPQDEAFVAMTPLNSLQVDLDNGVSARIERDPDQPDGGFQKKLFFGDEQRVSISVSGLSPTVETHNPYMPQSDTIVHQETYPYREALKALGVRIHFLADDRKLRTSSVPIHLGRHYGMPHLSGYPVPRLSRQVAIGPGSSTGIPEPFDEGEDFVLDPQGALNRVADMLRRTWIEQSSKTEARRMQAAVAMIRRIAEPDRTQELDSAQFLKKQTSRLEKLVARNREYKQFGLAGELESSEALEIARRATAEAMPAVARALEAFNDGLEAELDAKKNIHDRIETFVRNVNDFLRRKTLSFSFADRPSNPFKLKPIETATAAHLAPSQLSSGEKQLLMLFCHALLSVDAPSIIIVDEPEISLNVKWQRSLLDSLAEVGSFGTVQFVMATHSLELLTQHRTHVVRLDT